MYRHDIKASRSVAEYLMSQFSIVMSACVEWQLKNWKDKWNVQVLIECYFPVLYKKVQFNLKLRSLWRVEFIPISKA